MVAIEGEAGIGKTALVEAFLAEAGEPVIRAHGTPGDPPLPWGVLAEIFGQLPGVMAPDRGMALNPQALPTAVRETLAGYMLSGKIAEGTALLRGALDALGRGEPVPEPGSPPTSSGRLAAPSPS